MADPKKIFIVDDDNFLLDMYALKFTQKGFDVSTSLSSVEALTKIKEGFSPDILLLDVVMPEMDGFEFLEKIKEDNLAQNSIKIILSNRGAQSDILKGESLGAKGYIVKATCTPTEVINKVFEIIEKD